MPRSKPHGITIRCGQYTPSLAVDPTLLPSYFTSSVLKTGRRISRSASKPVLHFAREKEEPTARRTMRMERWTIRVGVGGAGVPKRVIAPNSNERAEGAAGSARKAKTAAAADAEDEQNQLSVLALLVTALRKSMASCRGRAGRRGDGGGDGHGRDPPPHGDRVADQRPPRHSFDRFHGFLVLPVEFEVEIPCRVPSARVLMSVGLWTIMGGLYLGCSNGVEFRSERQRVVWSVPFAFLISGQDKSSSNTSAAHTSQNLRPNRPESDSVDIPQNSATPGRASAFSDNHSHASVPTGMTEERNGFGSRSSSYEYSRGVFGATLENINHSRSRRYDARNPVSYPSY
ncbi:hypothetical protein NL676_021264 [Syzygium grande]|nr:hypothetical protein NL676_021264 [Syzygium grande]